MGNQSSLQIVNACTVKETVSGACEKQCLKFGLSGMKGLRASMEDRHIHCLELCVGDAKLDDHSIFGVFDGHGGGFAATFLENNFLQVLQSQPEIIKYVELQQSGIKSREDTNGIMLLKEGLNQAFVELDKRLIAAQQKRNQAYTEFAATKLENVQENLKTATNLTITNKYATADTKRRQDSPSKKSKNGDSLVVERSGSTAVVVLLTPSHIVCANTGDSRAILRRNGCVLPLSFDHKPSEIAERSRIQNAGGTVKGKRIDGDLAVSRAFGDFPFKADINLPVGKQKVSVVPDITIYPRSLDEDEFIVLACDGVWDVASNQECADYVHTMLLEGETDMAYICEEALDTCLERKSRDNMTIALIGLPGIVRNSTKKEISQRSPVLWGLRTARMAQRMSKRTLIMASETVNAIGRDIMMSCS